MKGDPCALCSKPVVFQYGLLCEACSREETISIIERRLEELAPADRVKIFVKFCRTCGEELELLPYGACH